MDERNRHSENPYSSPTANGDGVGPPTPAAERRHGCVLIVGHMLITSVIAPALGGAVLTFIVWPWREVDPPIRCVTSLSTGLVSTLFVSPITVSLGVALYPLCILLRESGRSSDVLWSVRAGFAGFACGLLIAPLAVLPAGLTVVVGSVVGAASGLFLRRLWMPG